MKLLISAIPLAVFVMSAQTIRCPYVASDASVTLDPSAAFWKDAPVAAFAHNSLGKDTGLKPTEVRVKWSKQFLYVLFVGPYDAMHLKPNPVTNQDTVPLWDWDVAEMFIGS